MCEEFTPIQWMTGWYQLAAEYRDYMDAPRWDSAAVQLTTNDVFKHYIQSHL